MTHNDETPTVALEDQKALSKLSKSLVEQVLEGLEAWQPEQVYQQAINWVGEEIQEHLLDSFLNCRYNEVAGMVDIHKFFEYLGHRGLMPYTDPRLESFMQALSRCETNSTRLYNTNLPSFLPKDLFKACLLQNPTIMRAIRGEFVIENFHLLTEQLEQVFNKCRDETGGEITTYIPSLAEVDPAKWAMSICTIDGQTFSCGDATDMMTLQSVTKPLFYGMCLDELGDEVVHRHVGKEPSGHGFNKISLNFRNMPHNPVVNTGAITLAGIYRDRVPMYERFQRIMQTYNALAAGSPNPLRFNNTIYLSERDSGHRNYAIGHYLKSKGCLQDSVNLTNTLELYFQMCSIEASTQSASVIAATLANGGENVFTKEQVLSERSVQNTLSIMYSCGMYDYSGEWAFEIGIPAKSGVSGLLILVIPDVMGMALWSPLLDVYGNSVRGVTFAKEMVKAYSDNQHQNILHPFSNRRHQITAEHNFLSRNYTSLRSSHHHSSGAGSTMGHSPNRYLHTWSGAGLRLLRALRR